ncbi:MAG: DNA mismatch repair endonuclease MutL [Ignavibacteriae bacterium]|nr:DNA mismatch repair endonuclease MutL [Ignavibacteriota bacterium]
MSRTINILPEVVASKIAAGEVIQRPASAVKELLENSLDAGANSIKVIIAESGKSLIQVIDDGCGMSAEDAAVAFGRHATSKISKAEDLECIETFGFRGEALATIAAIAQVEMKTRQTSSEVATKVRIEGGLILEIGEDSAPVGTSIRVKNLFYNTPARRKFQKSDQTEYKHIADAIQRAALAHPEITFEFISDDETIFNFRSGELSERLKDIFGENLSKTVFYFEDEVAFARVSGFLGKPDFARKGKTEQYLYLNGRYIQNKSLNHAVFQAYENLLEKGSFPFFVLFIEIDPTKVDVNVHPSKMEVKFDDEQTMYRFVLSSVRRALSEHDLIPSISVQQTSQQPSEIGVRFTSSPTSSQQRASGWEDLLRTLPTRDDSGLPFGNTQEITGREYNTLPEFQETNQQLENVRSDVQPINSKPLLSDVRIWQLHNKYILIPIEEGLMLVDQHAAHERVMYERILKRFEVNEPSSQQLLFPVTVELSASDTALVTELHPVLEGIGFSLKFFGKNTIVIDGVPSDVKSGNEATILQSVLDLYKDDNQAGMKLEQRERLVKSFSCKAAIRAGDPLSETEMRSLLDQLFLTQIPYVCPHGRPTIIRLSLPELDKRFRRIL